MKTMNKYQLSEIKQESEYKALILAAGLGTRLRPFTDCKPKALVSVNGKPILFKQIENLQKNGIMDITVVAGYKADILQKEVLAKYPEVKIIESTDYASTNNMYSAYLGINHMFPDGDIGPFYMMNADVFFDASVMTALKNMPASNLVVVDIGRYIAESMKVIRYDGRLVAISKQIPQEQAIGCSIDIYKFGKDGGEAFFNHCADYIEGKKNGSFGAKWH